MSGLGHDETLPFREPSTAMVVRADPWGGRVSAAAVSGRRDHAYWRAPRPRREKPLLHLAPFITLDHPAAGKPAQHPDAHLLGDGSECPRRQFSGGAKAHGLRVIIGLLLGRLKDAVDDAAMVMRMAVERGTEAVDEADRPEAGLRAGSCSAPACWPYKARCSARAA